MACNRFPVRDERKARFDVMAGEKPAIRTADIGGPGFKTFFEEKLVCEINIRLAIQKVAEIHSPSCQMYCVDLKEPPIERPIGKIVMKDLARPSGFSAS